MRCSAFFLLLAGVSGCASEFSTQIVDGLSRPLAGVRLDVACESGHKYLHLESDQNGIARGTYNAARCKPLSVSVEKQGYQSYISGVRERYVVQRTLKAEEVLGVLKLDRAHQQDELRELLAGDYSQESERFLDSVFFYEAHFRPLLRNLARDPEVTEPARDLLAMIAVSEDLDLIVRLPSPRLKPGFPERWRYRVVTALVSPDSEEQWEFLRRCAFNEFNDRWVDAGAIQTLKLTASRRSLQVLEEAQRKNQAQASRIAKAIDYLNSNPVPLVGPDLNALAERVAQIIGLGWVGNGKPRFNEAADKVLIDLTYQTTMDRFRYTATFHRTDDSWKLRGVHESYQAFAPVPILVRKR